MDDEMTYETQHFSICYSQECVSLVKQIAGTLRDNMERIMGFFRLDQLDHKIPVVIYSDRAAYISHIEECGQTYREWMIADTFDGRIHILSMEECRRSQSHVHMEREEYARLIVHEFVHICQQQVEPDCDGCVWFWEALATNLSGQVAEPVAISCSKEELMFEYQELPAAYAVSYPLGKYMLEHMSSDQIYEYICRPEILREDTEEILKAAAGVMI